MFSYKPKYDSFAVNVAHTYRKLHYICYQYIKHAAVHQKIYMKQTAYIEIEMRD